MLFACVPTLLHSETSLRFAETAARAVLLPVRLGATMEAGAGVALMPRGAWMTWALSGSALLLAGVFEVRGLGLLNGVGI